MLYLFFVTLCSHASSFLPLGDIAPRPHVVHLLLLVNQVFRSVHVEFPHLLYLRKVYFLY